MQYADGPLLFLENKISSAINLKWVLSYFEQMSRMRINFHKCNLVPIYIVEGGAQMFAQMLSCKLGDSPLQYLGVPLHHSKLRKEDVQPIVDFFLNKQQVREGNFLIMLPSWSW
jgi:hypothetical protein